MNNIFNITQPNTNQESTFSKENMTTNYDLIDLLERHYNLGNVKDFPELNTEYFLKYKLYTAHPKKLLKYMPVLSQFKPAFKTMLTLLEINDLQCIKDKLDTPSRELVEKEIEFRKNKYDMKTMFFKYNLGIDNDMFLKSMKDETFIYLEAMNFYRNVGQLVYRIMTSHPSEENVKEIFLKRLQDMSKDELIKMKSFPLEITRLIRLSILSIIDEKEIMERCVTEIVLMIMERTKEIFNPMERYMWKNALLSMICQISSEKNIDIDIKSYNLVTLDNMFLLENLHINNDSHTIDEDREDRIETDRKEMEAKFSDNLFDLYVDDDPEDFTNDINLVTSLIRTAYLYESVTSSILKKTNKAHDTSRKLAGSVKNAATDVKRVAKSVRSIPQPFEDLVKNTFNKIKQMDSENRREAIIAGNFKGRLMRLIRVGIKIALGGGAIHVLGPVAGSIAILGGLAVDSKVDYKHRQDILAELETEHKILKEKLDDSRSDNDKKGKYELMRIEGQLDREIRRIKMTI